MAHTDPSSHSEGSPLTPAEESALVQMAQANSRPMRTCLALAIKVSLWMTLASLAASAIALGVGIEGSFLARHLKPSEFIGITVAVELMAHNPEKLGEMLSEASGKEQADVLLVLIPSVVILAGTVVFHWLARKQLGLQLTLTKRTIVYFVSYAVVFISVRIAAWLILISVGIGKIGKVVEQAGGILEILGYMAGLIAAGSIITAVFNISKRGTAV